MRSFSGSAGPSGSSMRLFQVLPLTGVTADSAALATPGTPAAASSARRNSSGRAAGSSCARCALTLATRIGSRSKPRFRLASDENVRTNRPGGDDEHQRQRDLQHDEHVAEAEPSVADDPASLRLERVVRLHARAAQRRRHAEEQRRRDRRSPAVNPSTRQSSERSRNTRVGGRRQLPHEQPAAPLREEQPEQRADAGQQQALAQQLPRDPQARRAERDAHAELVPARGRAREEQVRDVRARDQQHERRRPP